MHKTTCRDGAICHHKCDEGRCFREWGCSPLPGFEGPWGRRERKGSPSLQDTPWEVIRDDLWEIARYLKEGGS